MPVIIEMQITMAAQNVTKNITLSSWRNTILYGNTCTYLRCAINFRQATPVCWGLKAWAHKMWRYCDRTVLSVQGTQHESLAVIMREIWPWKAGSYVQFM